MRHAALGFVTLAVLAVQPDSARSELALATPQSVVAFRNGHPETPSGCGVRADYAFPGFTLRIELVGIKHADGADLRLRAFSPTTMGMYLKDVWLRTQRFASETLLKRAQVNSIGVLEAKGVVDRTATGDLFGEIVQSGATVEVFTDTTLPAARVPLRLPGPLPSEVAADLDQCEALAHVFRG